MPGSISQQAAVAMAGTASDRAADMALSVTRRIARPLIGIVTRQRRAPRATPRPRLKLQQNRLK
jgi:hypothetical protein